MGGKMAVGGLRAGVEPFIEQLPRLRRSRRWQCRRCQAAMAAGLANMVASMSRGKKAYLQYDAN